jgi:hypothetical protein
MQWFEFAIGIPPAMGEGAKFGDFGSINVHVGLLVNAEKDIDVTNIAEIKKPARSGLFFK